MARKIVMIARVVLVLSFLLVLWNLYYTQHLKTNSINSSQSPVGKVPSTPWDPVTRSPLPEMSVPGPAPSHAPGRPITIAAVACGERVNETLNMIKSALVFSNLEFQFIVFADDHAKAEIAKLLQLWPAQVLSRMKLDLRQITFPGDKSEEWKKLFKPCASQRLFFPSILVEVDSLLYMDTDTVFLTSPLTIWDHFSKMTGVQMAAVAPEHEDYSTGWYNRFARHPYYGNLGVNSGVMLMNLTRMRQFGWEKYVVPIYQEYKSKITWGDQDIINIVFHFHPEKLYVYPCHYNYRPDHCMYMSVCKSAEQSGIYVLHGNRGSFHNEKQPAFKAVYSAIDQFAFGSGIESLLDELGRKLSETTATNCGKMSGAFVKAIEEAVKGFH